LAETQDMTLQAQLESMRQSPDGRLQPRKKLRLLTEARSSHSGAVDVLILDISPTGMLVQSDLPLEQGETIEIELPRAGVRQAEIVWSSDKFFGCSFATPIASAAVSAALLKGLPGETVAPATPGPSAPTAAFGKRLASLRGERGWSIEEVAVQLGVSRQAVWYWETGKRLPRARLVKRVAELFGVPQRTLLARQDMPEPIDPVGMADAVGIIEDFRRRIAARLGFEKDKITISIEF